MAIEFVTGVLLDMAVAFLGIFILSFVAAVFTSLYKGVPLKAELSRWHDKIYNFFYGKDGWNYERLALVTFSLIILVFVVMIFVDYGTYLYRSKF